MRIAQLDLDPAYAVRCSAALRRFLAQPGPDRRRPCPGCRLPCPCSGSRDCPCACSPRCATAPRQMSSDPDRFPIEAGIVPLVYAFHCLGVCPPCWSCEGHEDVRGGLRRVPQVWFYADSAIYPRLVEEHLADLRMRRTLERDWHVVVTSHDPHDPCPAFRIEPAAEKAPLAALRRDVARIAEGLRQGMRMHAKRLLGYLERAAALH